MAYRIEYFKEGIKIGTTPWSAAIDITIKIARAGSISHGADFARIIDVDGSNAEIWSERRDVPSA